jgi:hypothetical protein
MSWCEHDRAVTMEQTTTMNREVRERLAAMLGRLERATPGPWRVLRNGRICDPEGIPVAQTPATTELGEPTRQDLVDAALIANAPADLAWLLGLVEQLSGEEAACE